MSGPKVNCLSIVTKRTFGLMGDCGEESQFTLISSKDNFIGGRLLCDGGDRSLKLLLSNYFLVLTTDEGDVVHEDCHLQHLRHNGS